MAQPLIGHIARRNEHQITIGHAAGTVSASDFSEIRFAVSEKAGRAPLIEKLKSVSGDLAQLSASGLVYRVNIDAEDTSTQTEPRTLYWQLSVTPTGQEAIVIASGLYELRLAT